MRLGDIAVWMKADGLKYGKHGFPQIDSTRRPHHQTSVAKELRPVHRTWPLDQRQDHLFNELPSNQVVLSNKLRSYNSAALTLLALKMHQHQPFLGVLKSDYDGPGQVLHIIQIFSAIWRSAAS